MSPTPAQPQPASTQASAPAATAAAADAPAPIFHSRGSRSSATWLWIALPIVGLSIVPVIGLVYAATTSFGKGADASAESATVLEDDLDGTGVPGAKKKSTSSRKTKTTKTASARTDEAETCCAKLRDLGKTAEIAERSKFLGAASLCQGAADAQTAYKRVERNLRVAGIDIPPECEGGGGE